MGISHEVPDDLGHGDRKRWGEDNDESYASKVAQHLRFSSSLPCRQKRLNQRRLIYSAISKRIQVIRTLGKLLSIGLNVIWARAYPGAGRLTRTPPLSAGQTALLATLRISIVAERGVLDRQVLVEDRHEVSTIRTNIYASMKEHVTRSSVAAGDDLEAPHSRQFTFPDDSSTQDILNAIITAGYLASIAGGCASWIAMSQIPIAVVAQQWPAARMLTLSLRTQDETVRPNGEMKIHFDYQQQADPEELYARLESSAPLVPAKRRTWRVPGVTDVIFADFGIEIIKRSGKLYVRYDSGHLVCKCAKTRFPRRRRSRQCGGKRMRTRFFLRLSAD